MPVNISADAGGRGLPVDDPFPAAVGPDAKYLRARLGLVDALILALPVALCLGHGWSLFFFSSFTPRMAVLFAAGITGLFLLVRTARYRDPAARAAVLVVVWSIGAAFFTGAPLLALKGTIGRESSALIFALALGVWALGRASSRRVVDLMPYAVLAGLGTNAVVGVAQVVFQIDSGAFSLQFERATGLTPNPVYFGALAAAGAALSAALPRLGLARRVALVVSFGVAAELSGSRVALAAGLAGIAATSLDQSRTADRLRVLALPAGYLVGVAFGSLLTVFAGGESSTGRLGQNGGGRLDAWGYAVEAIAERPFVGWGLGRFRAATQARFSPEFVRTAAMDDLTQAWFDPHNVLLELAVGLGLVGLMLALGWLILASRELSGPLVPPLLVLALVILLQPAGLAILPLGMLLLGCSAGEVTRPETRHVLSTPALVALLVGVAMAAWLSIGDLRFGPAAEQVDPERMEEAAAWFPRDGVVADLVAQAWFIEEEFDQSLRPKVIEWSERAIGAEPDRPYFHAQFASRLLAFEDYAGARGQVEAGLELQPWHLRSLIGAYVLGERSDDTEMRELAVERLCVLEQELPECAQPAPPRK